MTAANTGPLAGLRVIEFGGVGPVPFCGMYFADLGADVVRIERPLADDALSRSRRTLNLTARGKRSIAVDVRSSDGRGLVLDLIARADILMEGFRPGVAERLGLGPRDSRAVNPRLVYGRMSGWGSTGPLARTAGHDINYLAMSGLLSTIGTADRPIPPLNMVGDFGGALYLVTGLLAALTHARSSGEGQVVEASILGGTIGLMAQLFTIYDHGEWSKERASNWTDGGAPFYRTYRTSDGRFMAVGSIEPQFYRALIALLGLEGQIDPASQMDRDSWPVTAAMFETAFGRRAQREWIAAAAVVDACCTPVLDLDEARRDGHNQASGMFVEVGGAIEPAPQPHFSRTPAGSPAAAVRQGADAVAVLRELGRDDTAIEALFESGTVGRPDDVTQG